MIYQSGLNDINEIMDILKKAISHMNANEIFQWDEIYPDKEIIRRDILKGNLFIYKTGEKISGYIVLNEEDSPEYSEISWEIKAEKILYVHRLCIHPEFQGRGIARKLMIFTEDYGRQNNFEAVRLDAFIQNPAAVSLYSKLNYRNAGIINLRKGKFYCFEKRLGK